MWRSETLKKTINNFFLFLILSYVQTQAQRSCRFNSGCVIFPGENNLYPLTIPVFSPVPNPTLLPSQGPYQQFIPQYPVPDSSQQSPSSYQPPSYQTPENFQTPSQSTIKEPINSSYDSEVSTNVSLSVLNFAQKLSRHFQVTSLKGEQIFSPVSIYSVLQLLLSGSNGKTYDELNRFLSYYSDMGAVEYQEEFGKLIEDLTVDKVNLKRQRPVPEWKSKLDSEISGNRQPKKDEDKSEKISVANGAFIQEGFSLRQAYQNVVQDIYKGEVNELNFKDRDLTEKIINNWVNEKTFGKISSIIDRNSIRPDTTLIMACALYFKAFWEKPFISGATVVNNFYPDGLNKPAIKVNMMATGGYFPYYDDSYYRIKVIGLPYKEGQSTMYIFQPYESTRESLRQMQEILNPEMIEFMISQMSKKSAILAIPRLHITNSFNLKNTLNSMGLNTIFSMDQSDFSLILKTENSANSLPYIGNFNTRQPPIYYNQRLTPTRKPDIIFLNRFGETNSESNTTTENAAKEINSENISSTSPFTSTEKNQYNNRRKRAVSYKVESDNKQKQQPLRLKDLVINKRITKLDKGKKNFRSRRDISSSITPNNLLEYLNSLRNRQDLLRPNIYVGDIIHKVDLVINEEGTEGAAATVTFLRKSGTDVAFRAETPFLILIRHDTTKLPIFYGAVFEPALN